MLSTIKNKNTRIQLRSSKKKRTAKHIEVKKYMVKIKMRSLEIKTEHFKSLQTSFLKIQVKEQIPSKHLF